MRLRVVSSFSLFALAGRAGFIVATPATGAPVVLSATGTSPAAIQSTVDAFRAAVSLGGGNNAPGAGPVANGRREISWDGGAAFDQFRTPGTMPGAFFNRPGAAPGSPRGVEFSTPGSALLVSQREGDEIGSNLNFGDINDQYPTQFINFSTPSLFAARGSTIIDSHFFVPSSPSTVATVCGFGAVFCDVDLADTTSIQFFDLDGRLLYTAFAPVANRGLSFIGVTFDAGERVASVRLNLGNTTMAADHFDGIEGSIPSDIVATDDFIFGEPQAVPTPATAGLLGLAGLGALRRRR